MAMSPAKRHFQRVSAAIAAAAVAGPELSMAGATAYEQQLLQLNQDRLRLKQVQSEQGKAELKRTLIPAYAPYIEGVLSAGNGAQDDVLTTIMVWCIDAGEFADALSIGAYVIEHNLKMPDRFARTTGCLLAEEIANDALKTQKAGGTFDLSLLLRTASLTDERDMPDQARAKLYLAIGRTNLQLAEEDGVEADAARAWLDIARKYLVRAIDLHSNCGGKKDLERVDRLLKRHAESKPTESGTGEPPVDETPKPEQDEGDQPDEGNQGTETGTGEPPAN